MSAGTQVRSLISFFVLLGTLESAMAGGRVYCPALYSELAGPQGITAENLRSQKLNQILNQEIREDGFRLRQQAVGRPIYSPIALIGSGLHGSIFSVALTSLGHSQSVVAYDMGTRVSKVFGELGGSFLINSRETGTASTNQFPDSPLVMKDLTGQKFPNSVHMATLATATQRASNVPVLFNQQVISIVDTRVTKEKSPGRYKMTAADGSISYSDKIVLATGLGEPSSRVPDQNYQNLLSRYEKMSVKAPKQLFPLMTADTFLKAVNDSQDSLNGLRSQIRNKTVAIVGVGDGAKIAIEALLKVGDPSVKILWLGQKAQTPEEYKASTWERYHDIADSMGTKVIGGFAGHVTAGNQLSDGRVRLVYGPQNKEVTADLVLNCTGYDNVVPSLLKSLSGAERSQEIQYKNVLGTTTVSESDSTVIGSRVEIKGLPEQEIYVAGPAAGALASEAELQKTKTQNPVSVEVLGPRSAALAKKLTQNLVSEKKPVLKNSISSSPAEYILRASLQGSLGSNLDNRGRRTWAQVEWDAFLKKFEIESPQILLSIETNPEDGFLKLNVNGLDPESSQKFFSLLEKEPRLVTALKTWMSAQSSGQLIFEE